MTESLRKSSVLRTLLMALTLLLGLTVIALPTPALAASSVPIETVHFVGGRLVQAPGRSNLWTEYDFNGAKRYTFQTKSYNNQTLRLKGRVLKNQSGQVELLIDLKTRTVSGEWPGHAMAKLYNITKIEYFATKASETPSRDERGNAVETVAPPRYIPPGKTPPLPQPTPVKLPPASAPSVAPAPSTSAPKTPTPKAPVSPTATPKIPAPDLSSTKAPLAPPKTPAPVNPAPVNPAPVVSPPAAPSPVGPTPSVLSPGTAAPTTPTSTTPSSAAPTPGPSAAVTPSPIPPAQEISAPETLTPVTLRRAAYEGGDFVKTEENSWVETTQEETSFPYQAVGYDNHSVFLYDGERKVFIELNVETSKSRISRAGAALTDYAPLLTLSTSSEVPIETLAGGIEPSRPARPTKLSAVERAICLSKKGTIEQAGLLGSERCTLSYSDGGNICIDSSNCQGKCLTEPNAKGKKAVSGQCQKTDNPFGCFSEVIGGKAQPGLCVD